MSSEPSSPRRRRVSPLDRVGFRQLILLIVLVPMVIGNLATLRLASNAQAAERLANEELADLEQLLAHRNFETAVIAELALYRGWPTVLASSAIREDDPSIVITRQVIEGLVQSATDLAAAGVRQTALGTDELATFDDIARSLTDLRVGFAENPRTIRSDELTRVDADLAIWSHQVDYLALGRSAAWMSIDRQAEFATALSTEVIYAGGLLLAGESTEAQRQAAAVALATTDAALERLHVVVTDEQRQRLEVAYADNEYLTTVRSRVLDLPNRFEPLGAPDLVSSLTGLASFTAVTVEIQGESVASVRAAALLRSDRARHNRQLMIGAALATLVVPGLLVAVVGGRTTRRVQRLARAAERISQGELGVVVDDVTGTDELAVLATAFNQVSASVLMGHDQVAALADGRLDDPVFDRDLPGPIGHTLRVALRRLGDTTAELAHHASHDRLTGLLDRRGFHLAAAELSADQRRAVLLLDLDGFKKVNDTFGHAAGDAVLEDVAERLRRSIRSSDVLARLGGDEFVIVTERSDAERLAARLQGELTRTIRWNGEDLRVSGSVGWTTLDLGEPVGSALARADSAMYRAKGQGPGRVEHVEHAGFRVEERAK
ncbi:MAG: GGDEF domain-containing protein [Acidimicrobiales bacterium]